MTPETAENARPQDQGRRHRAKGRPSRETRELLNRYQRAMRAELSMLLTDIRPYPRTKHERPSLAERDKAWTLAIKLAKELGAEIDIPAPQTEDVDAGGPATLRAVDF